VQRFWYKLTCEYDRLAKVLKHEAKSRTSVGEAVRSMKDDKSVEELIISVDGLSYFGPASTVDG
jgi:hypothetical protein